MTDKIITYSFYLLFFLTPLFWNSSNYELFEYNKMILTYAFTVIIVGAWLLKIIQSKSLIFNRTPLDIPLLLFLGANILSTIFSIDTHTSVWGYYSRSNGGLLSLISYLLLYWAFVSNMNFEKVKNTLKFALASGFIISLYAVFEHFGVSPSCVILRGEFNTDCWIQKVQERVFATLGQPNWLAAYLGMLIFPALYFLLTATKKSLYIVHFTLLITFYLAFTFTYSRGPTLGLVGGIVVFIFFWITSALNPKSEIRNPKQIQNSNVQNPKRFGHWDFNDSNLFRASELEFRALLGILASFLVINLLFGSALTSFRLISKYAAPVRPGIVPSAPVARTGTQLENGGTESGQIRLIVWKGALDIFKNYPVFGSGLETFAYSYYQFRPAQHNLTSEWDFLYNKAHNEFLNYLATTGIIGLGSYSIIIITFIIVILKKQKTKNLLPYSLLAAYIVYLISNFFLFSVVVIAIFFYLFPALAFVSTNSISTFHLPSSKFNPLFSIIYRRSIYTKVVKVIITLSILYLLFSIFQLWYADTFFAKGENFLEAGNPGRAYNYLVAASEINKGEPFYRSELGLAAAQAAAALKEIDATESANLEKEASFLTEQVLQKSPNNVSFYRTAIRTYYELSTVNPQYLDQTLAVLDKAISLAPTDPKLTYNKALILGSIGKKDEEINYLNGTLKLKPNYLEALAQLKEATKSASKSE